MTPINWKKGRGKLGLFQPLLGRWQTETEYEDGSPMIVTREFAFTLNKKYLKLDTVWQVPGKPYIEMALFGVNNETGEINFWSFINNGKQHNGYLADMADIHSQAIGFEAQMPHGLGRQAYWPHEEEGFLYTVASHSKKGWNHFLEHHYVRITED